MKSYVRSASAMVSIPTFDNGFETLNYLKFLYGRVRHSIFPDSSSLGVLLQQWLDWVLKFPGFCISKMSFI